MAGKHQTRSEQATKDRKTMMIAWMKRILLHAPIKIAPDPAPTDFELNLVRHQYRYFSTGC